MASDGTLPALLPPATSPTSTQRHTQYLLLKNSHRLADTAGWTDRGVRKTSALEAHWHPPCHSGEHRGLSVPMRRADCGERASWRRRCEGPAAATCAKGGRGRSGEGTSAAKVSS